MSRRRGGHLVVLMGAPGAGKSTYSWTLGSLWVVSTDELRVGEATPRRVDAVFNGAFDRIVSGLKRGEVVVFDTTAAHPATRRRALAVARGFGATSAIVLVDTPVDVCQSRRRSMDAAVVAEIHADIQYQWERVVPGEGWGRVLRVDGTRELAVA